MSAAGKLPPGFHCAGADVAAGIHPAIHLDVVLVIALPSPVLASAAISGLSTEDGRLTPRAVAAPYGHSVKGNGGVDCGVVGQ